jgi:protein-L-isoaspartate(D-aspartate) O-methyltransferase
MDQLEAQGGRLVVPVGDRFVQDLLTVTREGNDFRSEKLLACRFVPLLGQEGWEAP